MRQQIKQLFGWTAAFQKNIDAGKPFLKDDEGILALHFDVLSIQSEMCIEEPDKLVLGYTRTMMSFLLFEPSPKSIAMIGLGGGSLAKYCYRYLPQTSITVVEINPDVIALRNEFAIPADDARFTVLLGDGVKFVADTDGQFDVLMVDGFDTSGLPPPLCSQRFYDDCFASLPDNGIMVVNLWGSHADYDEHLARIHHSFSDQVVVVGADDSPNKIAFAVKNSEFAPTPSTIRHHANLLGLSHPLNFQAKSSKLIATLPIRAR
jgi:spermidine synthase